MTTKQEQLSSSYRPHHRRVTQHCVCGCVCVCVRSGSAVRLPSVDNPWCGQCGRDESQGQSGAAAFRGRQREEEEGGESGQRGKDFATHPGVTPPHQRVSERAGGQAGGRMCVCVRAAPCYVFGAAQLIVQAALLGEPRESCPEIPWHGVPKSFHYEGDTHTKTRTHTSARAHTQRHSE